MRKSVLKQTGLKLSLITVIVFLLYGFSASADWVSPDGFTDSESKWTTEEDSYDDNTSTYASDTSRRTGWGAYIILTTSSPLNCSRIRMNADYAADVDMVDVDVYRDGAWVDVYQGAIANSQWVEKTFTVGSVTQARFRWHYVNSNYIYWLYEFDFYEEPPVINIPQSQTDNASKVEEVTAILHGTVIDDGGEPCEYRFQYGTTTSYGTDTVWRSTRVTGEVFAELITGLTDGQLYHFRAQLKNSAGTSSGIDKTFRSGTPSSGWVSPSGNNDPDSKWDNEYQSYDDDLNTVARSYHDINDSAGQWSSFLYMTHASMLSDKIRYYARGSTTGSYYVDQVDVDVYRDGAWVDVYEGTVGNHVWEERTFTQGNVTQARIRFHVNSNNVGLFFELYEFNFYRISLSPPTLAWTGEAEYVSDGVNPESGDALTDFTFRVEYTDADNDSPLYIRLNLDKNGDGDYSDPGEVVDMSVATTGDPTKRDGDYTNGEIYTYTTKIPYGPDTLNCSYFFSANDGTDNATGPPTTAINAPDVYGYYYVRTDGDDANAGTGYIAIEAWKTINHALSQVRVGEINVAPGTYSESVSPLVSGSSGYRIKIIADPDSSEFPDVPAGAVTVDASGSGNAFYLDDKDYIDITDFTVTGATQHAIFLENDSDNNNISGLKISATGTSGNYSGVRLGTGCDSNNIFNNEIQGDYEGIYLNGTADCRIYNNMIYGTGYYGVRLEQTDNTICYFNSILNNNGRCIYKNQGTGNDFKNNILYMTSSNSGYYCFYNQDGDKATYTFTSDYNDIYAPNGAGAGYYGGGRTALSDWQTATGEDSNSISTNPFFVSVTDLHLKDVSPCQGQGVAITGYTVDADGDSRATPPDIGMDENLNPAPVPMAGTYTVKTDGSGNYTSIVDAVSDLLTKGINASVIIDVYSGTYMDEIVIGEIPGADSTNTVTIKKAAGETVGIEGSTNVIKLDGADFVTIQGFDISNSERDGILLTNYANDNVITGNHIHNIGSTGSFAGIRVDTYSIRNSIINNQIDSDVYGIYFYYASESKVYFNTISNTTGHCVYKRYGTNNDFKNNIFYNSSSNVNYYCFYNQDGNKATYAFTSDYNDFYHPNGAGAGYYGGARNTLTEWRTATAEDANSISENPAFNSLTSRHIRSVSPCQGAGVTIAGVTADIDGDARANPPDIGMDENLNAVPTPLSGIYTIKQDGSGDYQTFAAAVTDMYAKAVSGNVTFEAYSGTYMEQVDISEIPGADASSVVTFKPAAGQAVALEGNDYVFSLDHANYINIEGFELSNTARDGILLNYCNNNVISGNNIHDVGNSGSYACIRSNHSTATKIFNNQIISDYYGLYLYYADDTEVYFNSISNIAGNCIRKYRGSGNIFKNNILSNTATYTGYYCFYNQDGNKATYTFTSDYNDFYNPNGAQAGYYGGQQATLTDWRTATGEDANSIATNPSFTASDNLHIQNISTCQGAGIAISGYTTDYDGDTRAATPDIGMDENLNAVPVPMHGTYTIKQDGSGDFANFADAISALYSNGIDGAVIFDVYSGIYNEEIEINAVSGASASNTVTFRELPGQSVTLNGDVYTIYLNGASYIKIQDFDITSSTQHGVYLRNNSDYNEISGNHIHAVGSSGSYAAVRFDTGCDFNKLHGNKIEGDYYGIYLYFADDCEIYNNMISGVGYNGVLARSSNNLKFYFNSVYNTTGRCLQKYRGVNNLFKNNILYNSSNNAGHYCFYNQDGDKATYTFTSDYNDFYAPNGASIGYYGSARVDLAAWSTATGEDANSISSDPRFASSGDLHITFDSLCQGAGVTLAGYTADFDGETRADPPDIGADENIGPGTPMNGTYTVKQDGSGNYSSISAAAGDLNARGVDGAVTIDVYSGTYSEEVEISAVTGASSANTITIREAAGNNVTVDGVNYVFHLNGADYIRIENFDITSSVRDAFLLENNAVHNEISGNNIYGFGTGGSYSGIRLNTGSDDTSIHNNKINGDYYGLYVYQSDNSKIFNNMIYNIGYYGLYLYESDNSVFYFNSLYNATGRCIYKNRGTGNDFKNNILYNASANNGYYCFYVADGDKATYTFTSDNNDLYAPNGARIGYYGGNRTTLANWQTATSEDASSLSANPEFLSTTNLHIQSTSICNGSGVTVSGYSTDYDGDTRANPPDIGADENTGGSGVVPMNGTYTVIASGGGNYTSILDAVTDLNSRGVSGAVSIDIYSGTYNGGMIIEDIPGTSAANTVTIRKFPGETVTVSGGTNTFQLNSSHYVIIENLDITSSDHDGIYFSNNATNNEIHGNYIYEVGTGGNYAGIRIDANCSSNRIYKNRIAGDYYGIYLNNASDTEIFNNMIYNTGYYGIYLNYANNLKFYYNSVHNTVGRCIHKYRGSGNEFKNNILYNSSANSGYYCFYNQDGDKATYTFTSDYNDMASSGASIGYYGSARTALTDWQSATGEDANSISFNPKFISPVNLHIEDVSPCQGHATALAGYTDDFDGDARGTPSDIGADENSVAPPTPMNGTYTVKISGGDYSSIIAAVADLDARGVSGSVSIDVYSGTYTGEIDIPEIVGASSANDITIREYPGENVIVNGDDYAFYLNGADYIRISGFEISSTTQHGIFFENAATNNEISDNYIHGIGTGGGYAAVRINQNCDNNRIFNNNMQADRYGLYIYYADNLTIYNNMIYSSAYCETIYLYYSSNTKVYFNSLYNVSGRCIYKNRGAGNEFTNNILYNSSSNTGYYCFYVVDGDKATYTFSSDYNNIYSGGASIGYYGSAQSTINDWRTAVSDDADSISSNPKFTSSTDLHIGNGSPCQGAGFAIAGYTADIDTDSRADPPDIGADENLAPPPPAMNGIYTVKQDGTGDYLSITDAVAALNLRGVSGAVTIDVYTGVYVNQVDLSEITGASASNTVTFTEHSGETAVVNGDTYAFYLNGADYIKIQNFDITSSSQHGIYFANGANDNEIKGNYFYGTGTGGNYAAVRINTNCNRNKIIGNRIDGDYYGIYVYNADDTEIYNNMIYGTGYYGIYSYRSDNLKFYFNSLYNTTGRCLYKYQGTNCDFRNNIFYNNSNNAGYYCVYNADGNKATYTFTSDYNDFYAPNGASIGYYGSARSTLAEWQSAISEDGHSLNVDPLFTSTTDLHIDILALVQSKGIVISGITDDFDGESRINPPDIGADEVPLKLIITEGANNTVDTDMSNGAQNDLVMFQLALTTGNIEAVTLSSITFTASGSGNDLTAISSVRLFNDINNDGLLDAGDTQINGSETYSADNGLVTFTISETINVSSTENWLVVYNIPSGVTATGDTFKVEFAQYSHIVATGDTSGDTIICEGAPVDGGLFTVDERYDGDSDELPDTWEISYYGDLSNGANSDTDGDGLNAFEEFIMNENPTIATSAILHVNCNAGYIGDGSESSPFKYLRDALDAANDGTLILLEDGTFTLDDYTIDKNVIIKGKNSAEKTIIRGGTPDGASSDLGQMLNITSQRFVLSDVTLRRFRDDKPLISYNVATGSDYCVIKDVIFKDNSPATKSLIAPRGTLDSMRFYLLNNLFYNNSALSAAELEGNYSKTVNNTIVNNTFGSALIIDGSHDTFLINNILRNSSTEITDNSSGTLKIYNCNIEGAYAGAINSYDSAESFIDSAKGYYRLLAASPGHDTGKTTFVTWDADKKTRSDGLMDVGAFEIDANDSDGDGLTDAYEQTNGFNEYYPDSDNDGISDGDEINKYGTNPLSKNSDGDFIDDGDEPAMGMNPAVNDGDGDINGVYYTSFEEDALFPVGPLYDTIWGHGGNSNNSNVIVGNMTIENVGAAVAYDGVKIAKAAGGTPESSYIGWVDRGGLDDYWISISWKMPRAKLPTDINEAFNIAGAILAIDENGYLNIWDSANEVWLRDSQIIPDDWARITVHRHHPAPAVVNIWVETRQAFANIPANGPNPTAGTGKFRMSMSSVGEQDVFTDLWSALPFSPF